MAEVCTPTYDGVSAITPCPINLSLLTQKRALEEDLYENDAEHSCGSKRSKRENEASENDEKQEEIPNYDYNQESFHLERDGDKSKSSILQHFYSFIRRKTDDTNPTSQPLEEIVNNRERANIPPMPTAQERSDSEVEKQRHNGFHHMIDRQSTSPVTPERKLLDYNAALTRHIAARTAPATFMDIWNAMTVNALARAKSNKELHRTSSPFPGLVSLPTDYEQKNNSPNSAQTSAIPERTMRQNNWAVKVWRDWAIERNSRANLSGKSGRYEIVPLDIKDATVEMMSYWLPLFITEVRRRDKRPYPPDTLMQIASGLQRHLRHVSGRSDITFFDKYSPTFAQFREALKARSDAINSKLSNSRRDASGLSPHSNDGGAQEPWPSSLFNLNTAKGLFRAIFYSNCVAFHITSMEEHHSLMVSQFRVGVDGKSGQEYVEFTRENGEITRKLTSPYDPRCVVKIFKKYFECIPLTGLLYKRPLQSTDGADLRFSFNPVGINKLRETFKILFGGRRSGVNIPTMDDEDERDGRSPPLRHHPSEEDSRRFPKFSRSPSSNTSSSRASLQDEDIGEESRRQLLPDERIHSSPRSVITYAADNKADMAVPKEEKSQTKQSVFEDNNNDNSSKMEDEDCLTLKVPMYVKSVVILQNGKRFHVDLTETS